MFIVFQKFIVPEAESGGDPIGFESVKALTDFYSVNALKPGLVPLRGTVIKGS